MIEAAIKAQGERMVAMDRRIRLLTDLLVFSNEENARLKAQLAEVLGLLKGAE